MDSRRHEAEVDVRATPEQVWRALTDPEQTRAYYYGTEIISDWQPGSRWTSESGDELYLEGELLEVDPPRRIVQTFHVCRELGDPRPQCVHFEPELLVRFAEKLDPLAVRCRLDPQLLVRGS